MIISSSMVAMGSKSELFTYESHTRRLELWRNGPTPAAPPAEPPGRRVAGVAGGDRVDISTEGKAARTRGVEPEEELTGDLEEMKFRILQHLIEYLTGRRVELSDLAGELEESAAAGEAAGAAAGAAARVSDGGPEGAGGAGPGPRGVAPPHQMVPPPGWGMRYTEEHIRAEEERTAFAAVGKVVTADGMEIDFTAQLSMSRSFMERTGVMVEAGVERVQKDPLVINFDGSAAQLTTTRFEFDLDVDGTPESMPFVTAGSGFLGVDRNGDGKITDGGELFGPSSGQGFAELAAYDGDGNHWIDEADPIFSQLRLWVRDEAGTESLFSLQEKGVGAIYLDNVATSFGLRDQANQALGQVVSSGVYLRESGTAGTVQQVDLAV